MKSQSYLFNFFFFWFNFYCCWFDLNFFFNIKNNKNNNKRLINLCWLLLLFLLFLSRGGLSSSPSIYIKNKLQIYLPLLVQIFFAYFCFIFLTKIESFLFHQKIDVFSGKMFYAADPSSSTFLSESIFSLPLKRDRGVNSKRLVPYLRRILTRRRQLWTVPLQISSIRLTETHWRRNSCCIPLRWSELGD